MVEKLTWKPRNPYLWYWCHRGSSEISPRSKALTFSHWSASFHLVDTQIALCRVVIIHRISRKTSLHSFYSARHFCLTHLFFIATKTIFACIVIFVPKTCYVAQNDKQFLLSWLSNWYLICWAFHNCLRVKYTHSAVVSVTFIVVVARRFCLTQNRITDTRSTNNDNDLCSANIFQSTEKNFFFIRSTVIRWTRSINYTVRLREY